MVVRDVSSSEALELALIENLHRKDLNPIEEGLAYKKLIDESRVTQEVLAKRLGKDRSTITNMMRLLKLPTLIQKDLIDERLSMGHARVIVALDTPKVQMIVRDKIIKRGLSVRQAEALAKKIKTPIDEKTDKQQ